MPDIYELTTRGPALYVEADTGAKAVGFARRGIKARRLTGSEARALPPETPILVATDADEEASSDSDDE